MILGIGIASVGLLAGLSWHFESVKSIDQKIFEQINQPELRPGVDRLVVLTRWLGTKWTLMLFLGIILLLDLQTGITLVIAAAVTAGVERGIKFLIKRPRPFTTNTKAVLRQRPIPHDPSFPSGDATRIWFIFSSLAFGLHPGTLVMLFLVLCVLFVSFGRVRLGVHYPLDVLAGTALGLGMGLAWSSLLPASVSV